jgi:hypothetical protein
LFGFFEAGGTLYYVGAALGALVIVGIIATLVVLLRKAGADDEEEEFYDEYESYDDVSEGEYDEPDTLSDNYVEEEIQSESDGGESDPNISVDEDGTEWWEDDQGVWWYRSTDMDDWEVWED